MLPPTAATSLPVWLYRGYTAHEYLDQFGLINMNGGMYDPVLGRMLSPDNYVPDPLFTQDYNRFTYARNNPMVYTDPDGNFWNFVIGGVMGGVSGWQIGKAQGAKGWGMFGYVVGGAAIGVATAGIGQAVLNSFAPAVVSGAAGANMAIGAYAASGIASGAFSGAGFAALGGSNVNGILKGAFIGGTIGGVTGTAGGLLKYGHYRAHRWDNAIASIDPDKIYNGGQLGEVTIKGTRPSNYMGATGAFAATAAIADGPLPVGDIVGLTALAGTAIYTYSGVDLVQKMNAEIAGIMARTMGPQGVQYSLRATESGTYLCHTCPGGTTQLNAGDVWKYGETTKGPQRYTLKYLRSNNVTFTPETAGNQIQIKVAEKLKLYNYFFRNGHLPGGNKIFR